MRSELNEVCLIDRYLLRQLGEEETRAFEASLLMDEALAERMERQRMAHRLIHRYARQEARSWLEHLYRQLLDDTTFANQIKTIFA